MPFLPGELRCAFCGESLVAEQPTTTADWYSCRQCGFLVQSPTVPLRRATTSEVASRFRGLIPRIYELKGLIENPAHPDFYFQAFEEGLAANRLKADAFVKLERQLQVLDEAAWRDIKGRAAPHLISTQRARGRGWQQLFDVFSEAIAYGHLRTTLECSNVRFIEPAQSGNIRTPDLAAERDGRPVYCEVKTLNVSEVEAGRRLLISQQGWAGSASATQVSEGFLSKLTKTMEHAIEQLDHADPHRDARRIIFVVLHFDDWVGDYQQQYFDQIDVHLLRNPVEGAELVFAPAKNLFGRTFTMRSAAFAVDG